MKIRHVIACAAVALAALVATGSAGAAGNSNCPDGHLASGTYLNVVVNGFCATSGPVTIRGNLVVNGGGAFDTSNGAVAVGGSVQVFPTGVLQLFNSTVNHAVTSDRANSMVISGNEIFGGVQIAGGGGGPANACARSDVPLTGQPFNAIEDNEIIGNVNIGQYRGCWQGMFRNLILGNVNYNFNTLDDSDGNEIATNTITGNLYCQANSPAVQIGDSGGALNSVGGTTFRQCLAVVP